MVLQLYEGKGVYSLDMSSIKPKPKFRIGQLVHHRLFAYHGVVAAVDPVFNSTDEWYEMVAKSRPPKDQPWYHVVVNNGRRTYVAERNLEPDVTELN